MGSQIKTNKLVLLVEDDVDIRELFALFLEEAGFSVVQASDGAQALPLLENVRPDAVLTDLLMPNMDGTALAEAMKATPRLASIPIGLITATPPSDPLNSTPLFSRTLAKPCSFDEFVGLAAFLVGSEQPTPLSR